MQTQLFKTIIEISADSMPVKYEVDKNTGALSVDRILHTAMHYPCNYGFITNTMSEDGDPCDALVISSFPIIPGASIMCRAIGVLMMEDESGKDEKILCLPSEKIDPFYSSINDINELNTNILERLKHFFERYKDMNKDKWVKVESWHGKEHAYKKIEESIARAKKN